MRSTLILLSVVNVSPKVDSATSISYTYDVDILAVRRCFSPNYGELSLRMRSFDHITASGLKSDVIFQFSAPFSYIDAVFGRATPFSTNFVTILFAHAQ